MQNIFNNLKVYATGWTKVSERKFTQVEIDLIEVAEVVQSSYGNSVKFILKNRLGQSYIPLGKDATIGIGEILSREMLERAILVELSMPGSSNITRLDI